MNRRYQGTNFVTGMRAYAALAVVLVHAGGAGLRGLGELGANLANLGATGVYVFFTISGFSLAASFEKSASTAGFLVRRVFRLAPVYYAFLVIAVGATWVGLADPCYWAEKFGVALDGYNYAMHASFLGFLDYRVTNSLIGVEWSLNVEMFWYVLAPLVLGVTATSHRRLGWAVGAALALFFVQKEVLKSTMAPDAVFFVQQWSPLTHGFAFMLGIAAWRLRGGRVWEKLPQANFWFAAAIAAVLLRCQVSFMSHHLLIPLLTFPLLLTGRDQEGLVARVFCNRATLFVGTISYSLYLWHPIVLRVFERQGLDDQIGTGLAYFVVTSLVSTALSAITYFALESPFNGLGRLLEKRLTPQQEVQPAGPPRESRNAA